MLKKMSEIDVKAGLKTILQQIETASQNRPEEFKYVKPRLVAVSKTKPPQMIIDCYEEGQRHFGENYIQELLEKSNNAEILEKCKDIQWHFIGGIQTNKINKILSIPNLYVIETVDREKLADLLNKSWPKFNAESKLRVFIQVNTSDEEAKGGVDPSEAVNLAKFISNECPNLKLDGLMTIGKFGYDMSLGPNPDFQCLRKCREDVAKELNIDWKELNLSMGMSDDFPHAIQLGSTNVRVGSSIFGHRLKK